MKNCSEGDPYKAQSCKNCHTVYIYCCKQSLLFMVVNVHTCTTAGKLSFYFLDKRKIVSDTNLLL